MLCVDEAHHEQRLDPGLAALVPSSVEVAKVAAYPASISRLAGVGEIGLRAYPHLAAGVRRTLRRRDFEAVMITGSPYYPMLLAGMVKREFGLPVVLDFQDPWVTPAGDERSLFSKAGASHALARWLEPIALRSADFVTSVSDRQNEELAARCPWLRADHMAAMPIGGDPDDYAALRASPPVCDVELAIDRVNLVYVGTLLPRADGVVRQLFNAIARLREEHPAIAAKLRLTFVGTSNQPNGHGRYRVTPIAAAAGVGDLVHEVPQRVPYLEALGLLARADAILLMGSDEPHYTASKIYPALMSGRPCLGLFHRASSAFDILSRSGGARVLGFESVEHLACLGDQLCEAILQVAVEPESFGSVDPSAIEAYDARTIARGFGAIFSRIARPPGACGQPVPEFQTGSTRC